MAALCDVLRDLREFDEAQRLAEEIRKHDAALCSQKLLRIRELRSQEVTAKV